MTYIEMLIPLILLVIGIVYLIIGIYFCLRNQVEVDPFTIGTLLVGVALFWIISEDMIPLLPAWIDGFYDFLKYEFDEFLKSPIGG